MPILGLELT